MYYLVQLAFDINSAPLGTAANRRGENYPLQFALSDELGVSRFPMGPRGGFEGNDTLGLEVYDISSLSSGTSAPVDSSAALTVFASTLEGQEDFGIFESTPPGGSPTNQGWGLTYQDLRYSSDNDSPAYGANLPAYLLPTSFELINPSSSTLFKLSFSFVVNGKTFVVDPEMIVTEQGG